MRRHVTFIHGIANQVHPDRIITNWKRALADGGDGLDLDLYGVTTSMIYWADVMYAEPSDATAEKESVVFEGVTAGQIGDFDQGYLDTEDAEQQAFIDAMFDKFHLDADESIPVPPVSEVEEAVAHQLEAVPLPWFVKKPLMRIFLRDVHHYLFNVSYSPRDGESFMVQDDIRNRYLDDLAAVDADVHLVIAHSMGTVISYDVLKRVPDSKAVNSLITLGSPLGLSEIQDKLAPEYTKEDGFPSKVETWTNVTDRLDPVCAADRNIANDYRRSGELAVEDVSVVNSGAFRHPVTKYLRQPAVQAAARTALGL
jgi:hypothetical protein